MSGEVPRVRNSNRKKKGAGTADRGGGETLGADQASGGDWGLVRPDRIGSEIEMFNKRRKKESDLDLVREENRQEKKWRLS